MSTVVGLVVRYLIVGEFAACWPLDRHGDRTGFALVAQVSQGGQVLAYPGLEQWQDLGVEGLTGLLQATGRLWASTARSG